MRAVLLSLVVSVLCGVGALVCIPAGALGGGSSATSTLAYRGSGASVFGGALVIAGSPLESEQRQAQRQAVLSNPKVVAVREASRTVFAGANALQARRIALEAFPAVVDRPAGAVQLPAGQRIGRYLSTNAAQVTFPTGQRGAIESLQPIAKKTGRHRFTPLDLSLRTTGNGYAPVNPVVAVEIPARLSAGVSTPGNGVSLTPVNLQDGKPGGAQGRQEGASVIYANTQADTDTLVKVTPSGFDMDAILRSVNSPQELDYKVGLPAGARLAKTPASEPIQVIEGGETIATVFPPGAQDAEGTSVPTSMRVHGNVISVAVTHRSGSYRYPIEMDPEVTDKQLATTTAGKRSNWGFKSSPETSFLGTKVYEGPEKEYLETKATKEYKVGNIAYWGYETQGESKIFEIKTKTKAKNTGAKIESFLEFQTAAGAKETRSEPPLSDEVEKTTEYAEKPATLCAYNTEKKLEECNAAAGGNKNRIHFQQSATGTGSAFEDWLLEGVVSISEAAGTHATAEFNKSSPEIEVEVEEGGKKVVKHRVNALYGSGIWLSKNQGALELIGKDKGIGVSKTILEYESSPSKWEPISHSAEHEYLEKENGCQGVQCEPEHKEWWLLESKLPNGEDKIRYRAEDAMSGTESPASEDEVGVKVDTEKPYGLFIEGLPAANELSERSYELTAEATDGEGSTVAASGIKSLKLYIENSHGENNEITKTGGAGECMAAKGECTATATYTLSGTELGAGHHQITIVAIDRAGNEQREYEPISIHHSTPVALGPGSVDLQSGDFTLGPTDVSIGLGLSVSRNYSSRDLTQGEEGPLGAPWSMSLGTSESLVEMVDGSMLLTDSNGAQTVFALVAPKTEPPTYEAPIGDSNLKLTVEENKTTKEKLAYYLEDPALHTKDKFTLPSGDTTTWVPTIQEGALTGTTTASYTYEVLEPEAGKKLLVAHEELAPHPGTSCSPMKAGCQALKFKYATATTAKGENKAQWGNYKGRLEKIYLLTYNPVSKEMTKEPGIAVAEYTYDARGRLRAEWNPSVKPVPPTTSYGYDEEGHVTAMTAPGKEPWVFAHGTATNDAGTGRLLRATQAPASAGLWGGELAKNSVVPKITGTPTVGGSALTVSTGTWTTGSNEPVSYAYQWEDCNSSGTECVAIPGAINSSYVPHVTDAGHTLVVQVSALNGGGAAVASSLATALISTAVSKEYGIPKRTPVTQIIPGPSSNVWYTSSSTNEIGEMTTAGVVLKDFALPSGSEPYG
ncbi:MAG TPA: DUF6531 domain-containing protein, partial [Pirellulales bacterium]